MRIVEQKQYKARTPHRCTWCGEAILAGLPYVRLRGVYEREPFVNKFHPECKEAADIDYQELGEGFEAFTMKRGIAACRNNSP